MSEQCAECQCPIEPNEDLRRHPDTDKPHHWACLQEAYERERLCDEREAENLP
jgi:hypothetical protein